MLVKYYSKVKPICAIYVGKGKNVSLFSDYPNSYINSGHNYYTFSPYLNMGVGGQIIVSYSADEYVYIYKNDSLIREKICRSNYIDRIKDYPDDKVMNLVFSGKYQIEEPKYLSLVYDKFRHRYYGKVEVKFNPQNLAESQWSIIIMDENFDVMGEVLLKYSDFDPEVLIPSPDGVLLKRTVSETENMVLSLVKFEK